MSYDQPPGGSASGGDARDHRGGRWSDPLPELEKRAARILLGMLSYFTCIYRKVYEPVQCHETP